MSLQVCENVVCTLDTGVHENTGQIAFYVDSIRDSVFQEKAGWVLAVQVMHNKVRPRWTHVVSGHQLKFFSDARARDKPTSSSIRGLWLYS